MRPFQVRPHDWAGLASLSPSESAEPDTVWQLGTFKSQVELAKWGLVAILIHFQGDSPTLLG